MERTVIGIDFSTDPAKAGLARATLADGNAVAVLHEVCTATDKSRRRVDVVQRWIRAAGDSIRAHSWRESAGCLMVRQFSALSTSPSVCEMEISQKLGACGVLMMQHERT